MEFNKYVLYSFNAGQMQNACDDKVLVDIQRLNSMKEYDEVKEYVDRTFGTFEGEQKVTNYPNNVLVILEQRKNYIAVGAFKNDKQIFGLSWTLQVPEEE